MKKTLIILAVILIPITIVLIWNPSYEDQKWVFSSQETSDEEWVDIEYRYNYTYDLRSIFKIGKINKERISLISDLLREETELIPYSSMENNESEVINYLNIVFRGYVDDVGGVSVYFYSVTDYRESILFDGILKH